MPFFSPKTTVFIKFVVSLTIVNYNPSLTIVNDDPSLSIVNIIVNRNFFQNRSQIVLMKTIVIRFLKAQNESIFPKTKRLFLKTKQKTIVNDRLTIVYKND